MQSDYEVSFTVKNGSEEIFRVCDAFYKLTREDQVRALAYLNKFCKVETLRLENED